MRSAARGHVTVELIADGVHLSDDTVRTVLDLVGVDHVRLRLDARWLPPGWGTARTSWAGSRSSSTTASPGWLATQTARRPARSPVHEPRRRHRHPGRRRRHTPGVCRPPRHAHPCPRLVGLTDRGSLAAGSRADVVVVDANAAPDPVHETRALAGGRAALGSAGDSPRWSTAVFDLDGTLADTINLIVESYQHAFRTILGHEEDPP